MPKLKKKMLEKYYTVEIRGLFQTKSQFSEINITETDFYAYMISEYLR